MHKSQSLSSGIAVGSLVELCHLEAEDIQYSRTNIYKDQDRYSFSRRDSLFYLQWFLLSLLALVVVLPVHRHFLKVTSFAYKLNFHLIPH